MEIAVDKQGSDFNLNPLPEDPELHQDLPAEIIVDALVVDILAILTKNVLKGTLL